jgi:hypothetical protein
MAAGVYWMAVTDGVDSWRSHDREQRRETVIVVNVMERFQEKGRLILRLITLS